MSRRQTEMMNYFIEQMRDPTEVAKIQQSRIGAAEVMAMVVDPAPPTLPTLPAKPAIIRARGGVRNLASIAEEGHESDGEDKGAGK